MKKVEQGNLLSEIETQNDITSQTTKSDKKEHQIYKTVFVNGEVLKTQTNKQNLLLDLEQKALFIENSKVVFEKIKQLIQNADFEERISEKYKTEKITEDDVVSYYLFLNENYDIYLREDDIFIYNKELKMFFPFIQSLKIGGIFSQELFDKLVSIAHL